MSLIELLRARRDEIIQLAAKHGAYHVRLFGSVARREDDEQSDVDFLVSMKEETSLMDHAALIVDLEGLLGRKVDVAPENCLRPKIKDRILNEAAEL